MIDSFLDLRNRVHQDAFRFDLTPALWNAHYISEKEKTHVLDVRHNGILRGYVIFSTIIVEKYKFYRIHEICADSEDVFVKLIDDVIEKCANEDIDFIMWRQCDEPYGHVLDEKRFLTFKESAIMIALLNPKSLLLSVSKKVVQGKTLRLNVKGFEPVIVRVGKKNICVVENGQPQFAISTDAKTFIKLFFGRTSFWKAFSKRKITTGLKDLRGAKHFFALIRNEKWYLPSGDWC